MCALLVVVDHVEWTCNMEYVDGIVAHRLTNTYVRFGYKILRMYDLVYVRITTACVCNLILCESSHIGMSSIRKFSTSTVGGGKSCFI